MKFRNAIISAALLICTLTTVAGLRLEQKSNVTLADPSDPYFAISRVSVGPSGHYAASGRNAGWTVYDFDQSGSLVWKKLVAGSTGRYADSKIFARSDGIYVCGIVVDDSSSSFYLNMVKLDWAGNQKWMFAPNYGEGSSGLIYCDVGTDKIVYTLRHTKISENSTCGLVSGAVTFNGELIYSKSGLINSSYSPTDILEMGGRTVIVGMVDNIQGGYHDIFALSVNSADASDQRISYLHLYQQYAVTPWVVPFSSGDSFAVQYRVNVCPNSTYCASDIYIVKIYLTGETTPPHYLGGMIVATMTKFNSYFALDVIGDYNTIPYPVPSTLMLFDETFASVQNITLDPWPESTAEVGQGRSDLMLASVITTASKAVVMYPKLFAPTEIVECQRGFALDADNKCVACDSTCLSCVMPKDPQACTLCAGGLTAFDSTASKFNCSLYGKETDNFVCIKGFADKFQPTIMLEGAYQRPNLKINVNFNQAVSQCPSMDVVPYIVDSATSARVALGHQTISSLNATTLALTLVNTTIVSHCARTVLPTAVSYACVVYLDLDISSASTVAATTVKISFSLVMYNYITATSLTFGITNTVETTLIVNGTVAIPVSTKVCGDEGCTTFSRARP